jgi:hypothetical protein
MRVKLNFQKRGLICVAHIFPANEIKTQKKQNASFSTGQHKLIVPIYFSNDEHYNCAQIHEVGSVILPTTSFVWS